MPTVTAIRAAGRGRFAIELEGTAWRTLPAEAVVRAGLSVGTQLDRATLRLIRRELRRTEALAVASRILRARDHSVRSLEARLERAGVPPAARTEALEALGRAGLLDDRRFAAARVSALSSRGYGDVAIRLDLERAGLDTDVLEEALATLASENERAAEIVVRRGSGAKTARFLAARGFGEDAVEAAFEERVAPEP